VSRRTSRRARPLRLAGPPSEPPPAFFTIHQADVRQLDQVLAPYSDAKHPLLTATVTSPPYGSLKDYGHPSQIGWKQPHDEYLVDLRRVFRGLCTHTRDDGSLWLVANTMRPLTPGVRRLVLLPFELASEAESCGWILRDVIIWEKDKTRPWSSPGRLRNSFEYVLFFVKSARFKYRVERLREPLDLKRWWVKYPERYNPEGKTPANIWYAPIPVQGSWANTAIQHACPLPPDLVERMVLLSTDAGDVVFDPFAGSGVVVAEAERLARRGVGVELVEQYVKAFKTTVRPEIMTRRGDDVLIRRLEESARLKETILKLRVVKYGKVLAAAVRKKNPELPVPQAVFVLQRTLKRQVAQPHRLALADVIFVLDGSDTIRSSYLAAAGAAAKRQPASKFGVFGEIRVVGTDSLPALTRGRRLFLYREGRTHKTSGMTNVRQLRKVVGESWVRAPLIVSNVEVSEDPRDPVTDSSAAKLGRDDGSRVVDAAHVVVHELETLPVDEFRFG
jgi:DNA modification methylase